MHKKTITYKDFNDNERVEDCYFNLTKTELIEFAMDLPDNVSDSIKDDAEKIDEEKALAKVTSAFDSKGMFKFIKDLILKSYGVKKDEGRRFAKIDDDGQPLATKFMQTMAFEAIMEEFMSNDIAAAEFVNAVIPSDYADKMSNVQRIRQGASANN